MAEPGDTDYIDIDELIKRMDPDEKVRAAIRLHLLRQLLVEQGYVRLSDGSIVREGSEAEGEGETS